MSKPLRGLTICVSGMDSDQQLLFSAQVEDLGARFTSTLDSTVTHLVQYERTSSMKAVCAIKWNIPVVNISWIDDCRRQNRKVDELKYLIEQERPLAGYNFAIAGFDQDKHEILQEAIARNGGKLCTLDILGPFNTSYLIVPVVYNVSHEVKARIVTDVWLENSIFEGRVLGNAFFYSPKSVFPCVEMRNLHFCFSGIDHVDRYPLQEVLKAMGAMVDFDLKRYESQYLICNQPHGAKYDKAMEWCIPVIKQKWIEDMAVNGYIGCEKYLLFTPQIMTQVRIFVSASIEDAENLKATAQKLGAHVLDDYHESCTHVVSLTKSDARYALSHGKHVVSSSWVTECFNKSLLLNEHEFPVTVKKRRISLHTEDHNLKFAQSLQKLMESNVRTPRIMPHLSGLMEGQSPEKELCVTYNV